MTLTSTITRSIFIAPWIFVIAQLANDGQHRFSGLAVANVVMASTYIFLTVMMLAAFLAERKPLLVPKTHLIVVASCYALFAVLGLASHEFSYVLKDLVLVGIQIIFFIMGYILSSRLTDERMLQTILAENLILAITLGIFRTLYEPTDIVSPIYGYQALALYATMKSGRLWTHCLFLMFIFADVFLWAFGKQTVVIICLLGVVWLFAKQNDRLDQVARVSKVWLLPTVLLTMIGLASLIDITATGAAKKFEMLFSQFDRANLTGAVDPAMLYLAFDDSTAGRLVEYVMIYEEAQKNPLSFITGRGFGATLNLEVKNLYSSIEQFVFSETQGTQTLPAFLLLKGGLIWVAAFLFFLIKLVRLRNFAGHLVWPIIVMLVLALVAFATVFRFHFLFFFIGALINELRVKHGKL